MDISSKEQLFEVQATIDEFALMEVAASISRLAAAWGVTNSELMKECITIYESELNLIKGESYGRKRVTKSKN